MTLAQDIHTRIAEAEAEKRQAQQAEAQRLAAENAHKQKIAQADAKLAELRMQADDLVIDERNEAARKNAAAIAAFKPELSAALKGYDIAAVITLGEKIRPARAALVKFNQVTLEMARNPYWERALQKARSLHTQSSERLEDTRLALFEQMHGYLGRNLPVAPDFQDVFEEWVQAAPGGKERQIRTLLRSALAGEISA